MISPGKTHVILGRSGCGKSVLLKHLVGLMQPDSGKVLIDGEDISKLPERRLGPIRKKIGILFQSGALFDSMSVAWRLRYRARCSPWRRAEPLLPPTYQTFLLPQAQFFWVRKLVPPDFLVGNRCVLLVAGCCELHRRPCGAVKREQSAAYWPPVDPTLRGFRVRGYPSQAKESTRLKGFVHNSWSWSEISAQIVP